MVVIDFRYGSFSTVSAEVVGWVMSASTLKASNRDLPGSVAPGQTPVIQVSKLGARIMRFELADYEWNAIKAMLPNKPRGVPRANDRCVLNVIFLGLALRSALA